MNALATKIEERGAGGETALHIAAHETGGENKALLLIKGGAQIDARNKFGQTPLMIACQKKNHVAVFRLLKHGANPDAKDNFGWGPMHYAVHAGEPVIIGLLIQHGAKLNIMDEKGMTPLLMGVKSQNTMAVRMLLEADALVNRRRWRMSSPTPLDLANTLADGGCDMDDIIALLKRYGGKTTAELAR